MAKIEKWVARLFDGKNRVLGERFCISEEVARIEGLRMQRMQPVNLHTRLFIAPIGEYFK